MTLVTFNNVDKWSEGLFSLVLLISSVLGLLFLCVLEWFPGVPCLFLMLQFILCFTLFPLFIWLTLTTFINKPGYSSTLVRQVRAICGPPLDLYFTPQMCRARTYMLQMQTQSCNTEHWLLLLVPVWVFSGREFTPTAQDHARYADRRVQVAPGWVTVWVCVCGRVKLHHPRDPVRGR